MFIKVPKSSLAKTLALAHEITSECNSRFPFPVALKLEKIYSSSVLLAKKRYVGMAVETIDSKPYFDAKGIETVRRDGFPLLRHLLQSTLE